MGGEVRAKGSHGWTGSGVLFLRQKRFYRAARKLTGAWKASTETMILPSRIPSCRFPFHYWSVWVGLWEILSSVSVLRNLCSSESFPSQETFFQSSTRSSCWAMLPSPLTLFSLSQRCCWTLVQLNIGAVFQSQSSKAFYLQYHTQAF